MRYNAVNEVKIMGAKEKQAYKDIKAGKREPVGTEKGWLNMKPLTERPEEEARAIRQKAAEATHRIKAAKKNMKEELLAMLDDEEIAKALAKEVDITAIRALAQEKGTSLQTLILASMGLQAIAGNVKAADFVRDTAGYKPTDKQEIVADIMTDADRALLEKVSRRITGNRTESGVKDTSEESE